jgi:transcriptional repressor NrdR
MKCPFCHNDELKVIDSRESQEANAIRRRRECLECLRRFTTFETIDLTMQIRKRDGRFEDFQQAKLINGMDAACHHTTISHSQVIEIASQITDELMRRQIREIETTELGDIVSKRLELLDPIAFIRFSCVYRRFKNVQELMDAINSIPSKDEKENQSKV